jgi:hypothetical protein
MIQKKARKNFFNQDPIDPDPVFNRDHDRDEFFSIRVRLKNFNQSLLKKFQSGSGDQKLNTCAPLHKNHSRRKIAPVHQFSIRVRLKNFNQGLLKNFQSGFD